LPSSDSDASFAQLILYFGNLVASYLLSFCISLALEAPVVNLLKIAFTNNRIR
jgi:hypothetical protein